MPNPKNHPRKRPTQQRARATFDAVVQAADQLLDHTPVEALTIDAIAKRAGVSVGSLYQYFPSKEAIVATVIERDVERTFQALELLFQSSKNLPFEQLIAQMVEGTLAWYRARLQFYRTVLPETSRLEREGAIQHTLQRATELAQGEAARRPEQLAVPRERHDIAAFLMARVPNQLAHAAVLEQPDLLERPAFAQEIVRLLTAYLVPSSRA